MAKNNLVLGPQNAGLLDVVQPSAAELKDSIPSIELQAKIPGIPNAVTSWLYYLPELEVIMDPGTVLHQSLPQKKAPADSLGVYDYLDAEDGEAMTINSYNVRPGNTQTDIVQVAGTTSYSLCLRGRALRAGYTIPIPKIVTFNGQFAIPKNPQKVKTGIAANFNGVPIYFSQWELWYHVPICPNQTSAEVPPANLAEKINGNTGLPNAIQPPVSDKETAQTDSANWPTFISPSLP